MPADMGMTANTAGAAASDNLTNNFKENHNENQGFFEMPDTSTPAGDRRPTWNLKP